MNKKIFLGAVSFLLIIAFSSCYKGKYNQPIGDRRVMLIGSTYKIASITDNGVDIALGCKADDIWYFNADGGNGYIDDGTNRCTMNTANTTYTYGVTGDQRFLYIWNMSDTTTYGTYLTDSYRLDFEITYMTAVELDVKYYDLKGADGKSHQYQIKFMKIN